MIENFRSDFIHYSADSCSDASKMHCDLVIDSDGFISVKVIHGLILTPPKVQTQLNNVTMIL